MQGRGPLGWGEVLDVPAGTRFWVILKLPEKSLPVAWWKTWSQVWTPSEGVGSGKAELSVIVSGFGVIHDERDPTALLPFPAHLQLVSPAATLTLVPK